MEEGVSRSQEEDEGEEVPLQLLKGDGPGVEGIPGDGLPRREEDHRQRQPRDRPSGLLVEGVDEADAGVEAFHAENPSPAD